MGAPDVCKLPPPAPPQPFPNQAMLVMSKPNTAAQKVLMMNMPAVKLTTQISMSSGDEAGVAGGVVSGMNLGPVAFLLGSTKVLVQGEQAVYQTCTSAHNGANANAPMGNQVQPSQTKVLLAP